MSAAARVGDPIEHTSALEGLLLGIAVGAAAVVGALAAGVTIIATGGLAAVAVVGAVVALSAGVGELIGSLSYCTNKAGQIFKGSGNVFTNGKPAARAHLDTATCDKHGSVPQVIAQGSRTVLINGQPAARVGDRTICDGKISAGSGNVNIGGPTEETDDINPEVEPWLHWLVGGIGFGSAVVLTSPLMAITAFIDGAVLGGIGNILGGRWFGEDSDEQKAMTFGGAVLGGWFGARYEVKTEGFGSNFGNIRVTPRDPDSVYVGKLKGEAVGLPGVRTEEIVYTKRPPAETRELRNVFDRKVRPDYLKSLSENPENIQHLKNAGIDDHGISRMQQGKLPSRDWQVHHDLPLDDGGTNSFNNLTLIKNEPYHKVITNYQNAVTRGMKPGDSQTLDWPIINLDVYPPPLL